MNTQKLHFEFYGKHELVIPDDPLSRTTASDILCGLSYPFPPPASGLIVKCAVDLGAHVGEWSVMAAARWPQATVHAFEPNPRITPLLRDNARPYANIVIHEQAAGTAAGRGRFYLNSISSVAAKSYLPEVSDAEWSPIEVDYAAPDDIMQLNPDVLKIDIEGLEAKFVQAAAKALALVPVIYVEFHDEDIRIDLERLLLRTHSLCYARILQPRQGELMYARR